LYGAWPRETEPSANPKCHTHGGESRAFAQDQLADGNLVCAKRHAHADLVSALGHFIGHLGITSCFQNIFQDFLELRVRAQLHRDFFGFSDASLRAKPSVHSLDNWLQGRLL
jgi:hypothetical protein